MQQIKHLKHLDQHSYTKAQSRHYFVDNKFDTLMGTETANTLQTDVVVHRYIA